MRLRVHQDRHPVGFYVVFCGSRVDGRSAGAVSRDRIVDGLVFASMQNGDAGLATATLG